MNQKSCQLNDSDKKNICSKSFMCNRFCESLHTDRKCSEINNRKWLVFVGDSFVKCFNNENEAYYTGIEEAKRQNISMPFILHIFV